MASSTHSMGTSESADASKAKAEVPTILAGRQKPSFQPRSLADLRIKQVEEQLSALRTSLICAFNQLLDLKDLNTGVHSTRLAEWALHVGGELGLRESDQADLEVAALLHDIGKVGIPDSILNKPGKLNNEEFELMKKHPEYGWAVLRHVPGM